METAFLNAAQLSLWWAFPFTALLLTLALAPLVVPTFWHFHERKTIAGLCLLILLPMVIKFGFSTTKNVIVNVLVHHYIPFILLVSTLFVVCGGIHITTKGEITPLGNIVFLFLGGLLSSMIGTTGASILLIRPYLMMNRHRYDKKYLVIFFIFVVGNIGGSLTPIGDPPLFLGFLNGVSFFWPLQYLLKPFLSVTLPLLIIFYFIDRRHYHPNHSKKEIVETKETSHEFKIIGKRNIPILFLILCTVILSGISIERFHLMRDGSLLCLIAFSWLVTPKSVYRMNRFSFDPLREVAFVFFAIFITLIPIEAMLHLGKEGAFSPIAIFANPDGYADPLRYYFLTGFLSAFLDNAPTYLLFFHMAGGDSSSLMTTQAITLTAISIGAVFWGAMTYIGNAPNFMVKAIAERMSIKMPSFLGYMAWSVGILLPILLVLGLGQFR